MERRIEVDVETGDLVIHPRNNIAGGGDANTVYSLCTDELDGGYANAVYLAIQEWDGGDASG